MAGYYDEITGDWIDLGEDSPGFNPLDETSGTGTMDGWSFTDGIWTSPSGETYDLTYLKNSISDYDWSKLIKPFTNAAGKTDWAKVATAAMALKAATGGDKAAPAGYQGKIPLDKTLVREQVNYTDPNRTPGSSGRQYFTDTQYVAPAGLDAAKTAAATQEAGILSGYKPAEKAVNPYEGKFKTPWEKAAPAKTEQPTGASGVSSLLPVPAATTGMASGGVASMKPRYLQGHTDGMADKINTDIDGKQPAKLSHGEFVIPADVVSHLGNGNSDAGANKLYEMMARIRKARTGNPEQGKRIDPNKFMPGGHVGYANGGAVKGFDGTTGSTVSAGTTSPTGTTTGTTATSTLPTSTSNNLSSWAGDYVSDYLGKGTAFANQPYQAYTGPLTAGPSDLQNQQFAGISSLAGTGYSPTTYQGGIFDANAAQSYMNPYIKNALDPQIAEIQRQGKIQNLANQAQFTKQGAFGGSGSVLSQTEGQRNVLDKIQSALGTGYNTAYDKAMAQFNADQTRRMDAEKAGEASRQYSADFGLKSLQDLGKAGEVQRGIEQAGIEADKKQFEEQRDYPGKMIQFQKDLLTGLPITTTTSSTDQTAISALTGQVNGLLALYKTLEKLIPASTPATPTTTTTPTTTPNP